jgi:hypothetical protein
MGQVPTVLGKGEHEMIVFSQEQWLKPVILAVWEAEISKIAVPGQPKEKSWWNSPRLNQWLGTVAYTCHSSYAGKHKQEDRGPGKPSH